jgi:spore germination protein GerM
MSGGVKKMKRIEPFFYIVSLAILFVLTGVILFAMQLFAADVGSGVTVDPQTQSQDETLYDLWFTSVGIYDVSVDHSLSGILFSSDRNIVSLLDRDRRLRWDKVFVTAPRQAKLSSCGNYIFVGTNGGRLFFSSVDQQKWWDNEGDPVELVAFSPNASWVVAARSQPDQDYHHLDLFNKDGELQWSIETGPIKNLFFSSEYLDQANIYFTSTENELPVINAVNLDGEIIWSYENQQLAAVSKHGSRLAAFQGDRLIIYDSMGYESWSTNLLFEPEKVIFNPQNYNRILVYGSREGSLENLYYFDLAEDLLWMKRIADGSLLIFTAEGQHIVTSSWRYFKEDFTQMVLLDRDGVELNSWEVAMRVERLIASGHPHLIVVCGENGYIDLVNLKPLLEENDNSVVAEAPLYSPVSTTLRAQEDRVTLFFVDENENLIPVTRSVRPSDDPYRVALEELIRGPARGSSLFRTVPNKDIYIEVDFNPDNGSLYIDLSPELVQLNGTAQNNIILNSLLKTVSSFAEVKAIYLTVNQELINSYNDEIILEQPLIPHRWQNPLYLPLISGNRYYLSVQEGSSEEAQDPGLEVLLARVVRSLRVLPFVPDDLTLIDVRFLTERIQVNLNSSFRNIFPEGPNSDERLMAALVLDSIFLTVFENSRIQRVEILINGQKWESPIGYPSTNRFLRRPYFLNPEQ